jgi:hypothetical protein
MMSRVLAAAAFLILAAPALAQPQPQPRENRPGIGVDAGGGSTIDPTKNVLDLVEASIRRQDDLRRVVEELLKSELQNVNSKSEMRSVQDRELLRAATERLDSEAKLRAEFSQAIAATEKARVDAIRQVDKAAVDQAGTVATQTAANLAKTQTESAAVLSAQVNTSAEALRNLVATTAAESNRNIQQQFSALGARVAALEQGSAQGVGERKFTDPAVAALVEEVRKLGRAQADSAGVGAGQGQMWGWGVAGLMLVILAGGLIINVIILNRKVAANGVPQGG